MTMSDVNERIRLRAYRTLRLLTSFRYVKRVSPDIDVIGITENQPGSTVDRLLVTTNGLVWRTEPTQFVAYHQIIHAEAVVKHGGFDKSSVNTLRLHIANGAIFDFPVRGGNDKTRAVWEFLRYIDQVCAIVQQSIPERT